MKFTYNMYYLSLYQKVRSMKPEIFISFTDTCQVLRAVPDTEHTKAFSKYLLKE